MPATPDTRIRVLHVDDDVDFAETSAVYLERGDDRITVETAHSVDDALDRLDGIDCVVSDYDMPGRNGLEFLEIVREEDPNLPFILFTGKGSEEIASEAISAGVTDYLQKAGASEQFAILANRVRNAVERTHAERERKRHLDAIETAEEGISLLDENGEFIYVNGAYADLYGYEPGEMIGEHWELIYRDEETQEIYDEILPRVEAAGHWHGTTTGLRADGTTFPEDHTLATTERGELVCTVRDITDRREREQELELKNRAMDESPVGITITDPAREDNPIVYANEQFEELTGYAESEILGRNCRFLQGKNTETEPVTAMRNAIDDAEPVTVELRNYRKDGTEFWNRVTVAPVRDDSGSVTHYVGFQQDVSERKESERELQRERDRFQGFVDEVTEYAIFMLDSDGCVTTWNDGAERIKGYSEETIVGEHFSTFYTEVDRQSGVPERNLERARDAGSTTDEGWRVREDGTRFWANVTITALYDDAGQIRGFTKVTRDMTDRKRREDRLAGLNDMLAALVDAGGIQTVCNIAVEAVETSLDPPVATIALFDDERGSLRPVAGTSAAADRLDEQQLFGDDGVGWQTFASGEQTTLDASTVEGFDAEAADDRDRLARLAIYPLGRHGVFVAALPMESDDESDFLETIAATLRDALDRVEREELLQERERELAERNERLDQINRINDVIRAIDRELVAATSREEIERTVCRELAETGPYRFAWIGEYDFQENRVVPRTQAGEGEGYLDAIETVVENGADGGSPAAEAIRTGEPQVIENVRNEPPYEPWREAAIRRNYRSVIALPIVYRDRLYCVFTLYTDRPELVAELEREVLAELADNVAHAINALEIQRALVGDTVIELELRVPIAEIPLLEEIRERTECTIDVDNIVPATDGTYRVFFTARDVEPQELLACLEQSPSIRESTHVTDRGDSNQFECLVTGGTLVSWLFDHGTIPRSIAVSDRDCRVIVHLPRDQDVREFVESFQSRYPGTELLARRERERTEQTRGSFRAELEEELTGRQQETLRLAYASGYFESPRERTAGELAETMGISQPTFTTHLRASQRKLLDLLYGNEVSRSDV